MVIVLPASCGDRNHTPHAYRDYVRANSEHASRTASVIKDLVDYGKAKSRAESLEMKLELPASK